MKSLNQQFSSRVTRHASLIRLALCALRYAVTIILLALTASTLQSQTTHVISHLDEKLPASGNIIYCSSFQHAWKELSDSILYDEVKLKNPISLAGNLNRTCQSAAYSPNYVSDSRILPAGRQSTNQGDSIIVTSSFQESLEWPVEFQSFGHPMRFYTGPDEYTRCEYFGIHLREQEELLQYNPQVRVVEFVDADEFVVKLDARLKTQDARSKKQDSRGKTQDSIHDSRITTHEWGRREMSLRFIASRTEYGWVEIIIAKVPREATLLETIKQVENRINNPTPKQLNTSTTKHLNDSTTKQYSTSTTLIPGDILAIPKINLDISKEYSELLGKHLANKGFEKYFFAIANQNINFSMDEQGARAGSDVTIMLKKGPSARRMVIDGSFLIYLKEYGADRPYFAAWIDDPEWLVTSD